MDLITEATQILSRATRGQEPKTADRALILGKAAVFAILALAQELRTANEIAMVMGGLAIGTNRQLKLQ